MASTKYQTNKKKQLQEKASDREKCTELHWQCSIYSSLSNSFDDISL